jgi:hypothetical protein
MATAVNLPGGINPAGAVAWVKGSKPFTHPKYHWEKPLKLTAVNRRGEKQVIMRLMFVLFIG